MNQQTIRDIISGKRRGVGATILRAGLAGASGVYACAMRLRRWAYRAGLLSSERALAADGSPVPVICVGNLTTGGTGKTPMVAWVAGVLLEAGWKVGILTRGYKASDGRSDEADLLRHVLPATVGVVQNPDRVAGARAAIQQGANVLVMDDGFQHRRLQRNLDIVLIDATNPFGYGWCLPRGLLREPPRALADAHRIVITRGDAVDHRSLRRLRARLRQLAPNVPTHLAVHRPLRLVDAAGASQMLQAVGGFRVFAFCGLANPESFFTTLRQMGASLAGAMPLNDHARYGPAQIEQIEQAARQCGADLLVTTHKDAVKLGEAAFHVPLWRLEIELRILEGREELIEHILSAARG